jgi:hypothetical protein
VNRSRVLIPDGAGDKSRYPEAITPAVSARKVSTSEISKLVKIAPLTPAKEDASGADSPPKSDTGVFSSYSPFITPVRGQLRHDDFSRNTSIDADPLGDTRSMKSRNAPAIAPSSPLSAPAGSPVKQWTVHSYAPSPAAAGSVRRYARRMAAAGGGAVSSAQKAQEIDDGSADSNTVRSFAASAALSTEVQKLLNQLGDEVNSLRTSYSFL